MTVVGIGKGYSIDTTSCNCTLVNIERFINSWINGTCKPEHEYSFTPQGIRHREASTSAQALMFCAVDGMYRDYYTLW
jgi:hypothetical protein